jgi:hypothetical protein
VVVSSGNAAARLIQSGSKPEAPLHVTFVSSPVNHDTTVS